MTEQQDNNSEPVQLVDFWTLRNSSPSVEIQDGNVVNLPYSNLWACGFQEVSLERGFNRVSWNLMFPEPQHEGLVSLTVGVVPVTVSGVQLGEEYPKDNASEPAAPPGSFGFSAAGGVYVNGEEVVGSGSPDEPLFQDAESEVLLHLNLQEGILSLVKGKGSESRTWHLTGLPTDVTYKLFVHNRWSAHESAQLLVG